MLTVTENGYGKRTFLNGYLRGGSADSPGTAQSRGGKGLIDIHTDERNGKVIGVIKVEDETDQYLLVNNEGVIIRALAETVRLTNRNTKGVRVINLDKGTRVVGLARYAAGEEDEEFAEDDVEGEAALGAETEGAVSTEVGEVTPDEGDPGAEADGDEPDGDPEE